MNNIIALEYYEYKDDVSSCLFVKDFPGCPPGYMNVVWDTGFHCVDCGQHIYEIVRRKIPHECRHIDHEGKDRPVLDADGEKTYYTENAYIILCPRCVTYWPDDERIGEFDHKEMVVVLYDRVRPPDRDQLRRNRHRPAIVARTPDERFQARWRPIDPAALAELDFYREDRKRYALSKMYQQAVQAAKRKSHKDRPSRSRGHRKIDGRLESDYTYRSNEQEGLYS